MTRVGARSLRSRTKMGTSKTKLIAGMIAVVAFVATALFLLKRGPESGAGVVQRLPDGSLLELRTIVFTTNYSYSHQPGNWLQRLIGPITPTSIRNRFFRSDAS